MNILQRLPKNSGLVLLSLSLATVLWLFVNYNRESETEVMIPLQVTNVPPGFEISNELPPRINVRIGGPRIQLMWMQPDRLKVVFDLKNVQEGSVAFSTLDKVVPLSRELKVTRIYPSSLEVNLQRK